MPDIYAHSLADRPYTEWETLQAHAEAVATTAHIFADRFGWGGVARAAGLLHDIGKCSPAFQAYIRAGDKAARGPDHSTAGAIEAVAAYPVPLGRILAAIIAGHHAGLADGVDLETRLAKDGLPSYEGWRQAVGTLPGASDLRPAQPQRRSEHRGFSEAFLIRMLFSCLIDADRLETEAFYAHAEGRDPGRDGFTGLSTLRERLERVMAQREAGAEPTALNRLRARIRAHAVGKAALEPGLFTLTVPTGGGKTLASLSFALEHAVRHGLGRVVYVIPFTSIIEQTADVFRQALAAGSGSRNEDDILEHHASFDWDATRDRHEDGRGLDAADRLRRAAENWAAPVVVTTAVQFFESLFANRTSRCRKLHNLARSVIVLDEAQTMPLHLLRPCMAALDELARNYGATVVLCTATQPALRKQDGFASGLDIPAERELAPDPDDLYDRLRRVAVERLPEPVPDETIAARFAEQPQMLCIVNRRAPAQALYGLIRDLPGAVHLSTLMCPAHRRQVLAAARERLKAGMPVRIVSTSLIEAGVDIDLPEVWRAAAGLDAVAHGGADRNFVPADTVEERVRRSPPHGGADRNRASSRSHGWAGTHVAPSRGRGSKLFPALTLWTRPRVAPSRGRGSKPPCHVGRDPTEQSPPRLSLLPCRREDRKLPGSVTHVIASRNNRLRLASRQAIARRVARRSEMGAHPPGGSP